MSMVVSMLTPRCFYGFTRLSKSLLYANYEIKHLRVQYFVTTIDNLAYTTLTRNLRDEYDIRKQKAEGNRPSDPSRPRPSRLHCYCN